MVSNPREAPTDNLPLDKPAALPLPSDSLPSDKPSVALPNLPTTPESKPEPAEQPLVSSLPSSEPKIEFSGEIKASITYPVNILGKKGFDPKELTIKVGDKVTWTNSDPANKKLVLTFQKDKLINGLFSSDLLLPDEKYEYIFKEAGNYQYWTTAYGTKGVVIVEN